VSVAAAIGGLLDSTALMVPMGDPLPQLLQQYFRGVSVNHRQQIVKS